MSTNSVTVVGRLVADPELQFTSHGKSVTNFSVAVSKGPGKKEASFFDVTCWESLANNVLESLHKGDWVFVSGRLDQHSWESDGKKHSRVSITASNVGPDLNYVTATITRNERSSLNETEPF